MGNTNIIFIFDQIHRFKRNQTRQNLKLVI